jgi:hypothetical protein
MFPYLVPIFPCGGKPGGPERPVPHGLEESERRKKNRYFVLTNGRVMF